MSPRLRTICVAAALLLPLAAAPSAQSAGPITQLVGLAIQAAGAAVPWRRDPADNFLFDVDVPQGASALSVEFDYASPPAIFGTGYGKGPNATPHLLIVDWLDMLLFPANTPADEVIVTARLRLPSGWQHETALSGSATADGAVAFVPSRS